MSQKLDQLRADVEAQGTVVLSAITLLNGISARIDEAIAAFQAGNDQALEELSAEVKADTAALAAAVEANTPGSTTPG